MKLDVELINGVAEFGSGFNALWHGTIMETDAALWRGLPVPNHSLHAKKQISSARQRTVIPCIHRDDFD